MRIVHNPRRKGRRGENNTPYKSKKNSDMKNEIYITCKISEIGQNNIVKIHMPYEISTFVKLPGDISDLVVGDFIDIFGYIRSVGKERAIQCSCCETDLVCEAKEQEIIVVDFEQLEDHDVSYKNEVHLDGFIVKKYSSKEQSAVYEMHTVMEDKMIGIPLIGTLNRRSNKFQMMKIVGPAICREAYLSHTCSICKEKNYYIENRIYVRHGSEYGEF